MLNEEKVRSTTVAERQREQQAKHAPLFKGKDEEMKTQLHGKLYVDVERSVSRESAQTYLL